jgi:hypothetical protein
MQEWACGSKCFFSHYLDQTDITTVNPIHSKYVCGSGDRLDSNHGEVQGGRTSTVGRTCWFGRTCLVWLGDSFLSPNAYLQVKIPTQLVELY